MVTSVGSLPEMVGKRKKKRKRRQSEAGLEEIGVENPVVVTGGNNGRVECSKKSKPSNLEIQDFPGDKECAVGAVEPQSAVKCMKKKKRRLNNAAEKCDKSQDGVSVDETSCKVAQVNETPPTEPELSAVTPAKKKKSRKHKKSSEINGKCSSNEGALAEDDSKDFKSDMKSQDTLEVIDFKLGNIPSEPGKINNSNYLFPLDF